MDKEANPNPADAFAQAAARVLLVEDDQVNLEIARQTLEDAGLVVVPALSGCEAVALAQSQRFYLILMDLARRNWPCSALPEPDQQRRDGDRARPPHRQRQPGRAGAVHPAAPPDDRREVPVLSTGTRVPTAGAR